MDGASHRGVSVLRSVPSVGQKTGLAMTTSLHLLWSVWSLVMSPKGLLYDDHNTGFGNLYVAYNEEISCFIACALWKVKG